MAFALPKIGILLSSSTPYEVANNSIRSGIKAALYELQCEGISVTAVFSDPSDFGGCYIEASKFLLDQGIKHVLGCYTSSSRQQVVPTFEARDSILWYPVHYEGFECSPSVIYLGSTPAQHVLNLIDYAIKRGWKSYYHLGSDYVWAWENNRVMADYLASQSGVCIGEDLRPISDNAESFVTTIDKIWAAKPDFIFSNLIGEDHYQFIRDFRNSEFQHKANIPILTCALGETELKAIGPEWCEDLIVSSVYFSSINNQENKKFISSLLGAGVSSPGACVDAEGAYLTTKLLCRSLLIAKSDERQAVVNALGEIVCDAPRGNVRVDINTNHSAARPRIGISKKNFEFDIISDTLTYVEPNPYLVNPENLAEMENTCDGMGT
ncbi:transporter substrate-binding protein [Acetobacter sp. DsW_059]|uniref:transporter substrate-binding protein n=1 Tax=Acetobacter sp. DsW_059 TaxID=1670661 RepID=UPI000A371142|nr:transporter substrate-binding protein [Acetobacter sp. DsW_059]